MFYFIQGNSMTKFWVISEDTIKLKQKIIVDLYLVAN